MVEAHQRLIQEAGRAFDERDVEAIVAAMHPDAEVQLIGGFGSVMGERFQGEEGVRRFCEGFFSAFKTMSFEIERYIDAGDGILVLTRMRATGSGSDAPVELLGAAIYGFAEAKIASIDFFYDRNHAWEAAGLKRNQTG